MVEEKLIIAGLPETGKTTYLAALWHVLNTEEIENSLRLSKLDGEHKYLKDITDYWLKCDKMPRTSTDSEHLVSMRIANPDNVVVGEIFFPDMSGELFRIQWEDRKCSKFYSELIKDSSGILFFIHPEVKYKPWGIREASQILSKSKTQEKPKQKNVSEDLCTQKNSNFKNSGTSIEKLDNAEPWDPSKASNQVVLVELLQFISFLSEKTNIKLSIIISAWDIVKSIDSQYKRKTSPEKWLKNNIPLLHQYLKSNSDIFSTKVFGVSAQGGDFDEKAHELLEYSVPSERIIVESNDVPHHDITEPIKWIVS